MFDYYQEKLFMTKNYLIILASLLVINNQSFGLTFDDIKNNNADEQQITNIVKDMPKTEKIDFLDTNFESVVETNSQVDSLVTMLYLMPKESLNDKLSLHSYIENAEMALIQNQQKAFDFFYNRAKNKKFNIYYESLLASFVFGDNVSYPPRYKNYDLYYDKLTKGVFKFSEKNDRNLYINLFSPYINTDTFEDYQYDESDERLEEIMNIYFARDEFKGYEIKNEYHIYKLGCVILEKYNDNSAEFILKKLKDRNTNLDNLCYFLDNINFDTPITEKLQKDFDSGFYNPKDVPFADWAEKQKIFSSTLIGKYNPVVLKLDELGIEIQPNTRFTIIYMDSMLNPNNTGKEFNENLVKDIEKIAKQKNLSTEQREELIKESALNCYKLVFPQVQKEQAEQEQRIEEIMKEFDKFLKKYPDAFRMQ